MDLPLDATSSSPATPSTANDPSAAFNPYIADPVPHSRLIQIKHYGRPRTLCPPVLAHAAILNFFARVDRLLGSSRFDLAADAAELTGGMDGPRARDAEGHRVAREGERRESMPGNQQVVVFRPRECV
jgi:hypothetical protein